MEIVASAQNQHVKALRNLYTKKGREQMACYPVEGVNIVKDVPASCRVIAYYFAHDRYDELRWLVKDKTASVYVVRADILDRAVATVEPSGVVAVLPIPLPGAWHDAARLLVSDGVSDPGNVGTLLRTALAAGYTDVLLLGGADPYNPKVVRASMGGIYRLRVHLATPEAYLASGRRYYVLAMDGEDLFAASTSPCYDIVVGNEAHGVSAALLAQASKVLSIPMEQGIESLNAAVAGAIAMYVLKYKG